MAHPFPHIYPLQFLIFFPGPIPLWVQIPFFFATQHFLLSVHQKLRSVKENNKIVHRENFMTLTPQKSEATDGI